MKNILLLALALLCLTFPALAEDVCIIDNAAEATACTTDRSYLRVICPLEGEMDVTMSVYDEWGLLLSQRDYGLCSGRFRSQDVYLPLRDGAATYSVVVTAGDAEYRFRVTREQPRLTDSGVYALGLPLSELNGRSANKYAVILDADLLEGGTYTAPLVSGGMQLGTASYTIRGGELTVDAALTVDGEILKSNVYIAHDAVTAQTLGSSHFTGRKTKLGRITDLAGTPYVAVMVQLTVAYDEATAWPAEADSAFFRSQRELWRLMQMMTANEAVG